LVIIPYIARPSETMRRGGGGVGLKTVFAANDTLKKRFTHRKPTEEKQGKLLVYRITCDCGAKYVGKTCRPQEK
jgi:hypothetical protein